MQSTKAFFFLRKQNPRIKSITFISNFYKNIKINYFKNLSAFSVAEAMITLLIVSIALAAAAPIMSKQMKASQNLTRNTVNEMIKDGIRDEMRRSFGNSVVFFSHNSATSENLGADCPEGWEPVNNLGGRYIRVAGEYRIKPPVDCFGTLGSEDGVATYFESCPQQGNYWNDRNQQNKVAAPGNEYNDQIRRITGSLGSLMNVDWRNSPQGGVFRPRAWYHTSTTLANPPTGNLNDDTFGITARLYHRYGYVSFGTEPTINQFEAGGGAVGRNFSYYTQDFDSARVVPSGDENTPYSVALVACRYNR